MGVVVSAAVVSAQAPDSAVEAQLPVLVPPVVPVHLAARARLVVRAAQLVLAEERVVRAAASVTVPVDLLSRPSFSAAMARSTRSLATTYEPVPRSK